MSKPKGRRHPVNKHVVYGQPRSKRQAARSRLFDRRLARAARLLTEWAAQIATALDAKQSDFALATPSPEPLPLDPYPNHPALEADPHEGDLR